MPHCGLKKVKLNLPVYHKNINRHEPFSPLGRYFLYALLAATAEIEKGALITIDLKKTRLRVLPLF